jgi:predicted P-loop ATPase
MRMGNEYRELRSMKLDFEPLTERIVNGMAIRAHKEGIPVWDKDISRFLKSDFVKTFAPLENYLSHLPRWDGRDRIRALASTVPTRHKQWNDLFYKWFLSMVAHWREENREHANSISPLLIGSQGCGKSTWCANLLPPELRDYYTDSLDLSSKRKAELCLTRFGLINFDEFDSISVSQQAYLKHILQKAVVKTAAPYQSTVQSMRRYASFIGTSNNSDLLNDPTGSRRFLCVEIDGDINFRKPVNYPQLYAQAVHALLHDEVYWFTRQEEQQTTKRNMAFQKMDIEEQLFLRYFDTPDADEEGEWMMAIEIFGTIRDLSRIGLGNKRCNMFGRILKKHCRVTKSCSQGTLYWVRKR